MVIKNGLVFTEQQTFENLTIHTNQEKIVALTESDSLLSKNDEVIDASGCYVIPGLTDIHFHGCMGYDFCDGTWEAYENIAAYQLSHGVTSLCPATMTLPPKKLTHLCETAAVFMGIPLEQAVAAATIHPCRSIGMDSLYGSISPGKKPHFLLLDKETLTIRQIIKNGTCLPM